MAAEPKRTKNDSIIHVASGKANGSKKYIQEKAKRFDENNRILKEAFLNHKKTRHSII
ncbi:hypothetical protein [Heyndrickxia oleronia]|uniref:hypothetical protein n=1 Tax=Heyndrickxia oleronia TaxID=38875 RepID=UPI0014767495|nr:hypothetical protein [Heyndrickxia oleronia]MEC1374297.1 hypothetical protein [Heyndrickxia oleronia]QQZ07115.1 hypothetical protein I5818_12320 [Heyndrickxia oleronia]